MVSKHPLQERHEEEREVARMLNPAIETNPPVVNTEGETPIMEREFIAAWNGN